MRLFGAVALLLLACGGCAASPSGGGGQVSVLPVVTYTPRPGQAIPDTLSEASPFRLGVSVRSGFACFTSDGMSVEWPAGYSAVKEDGKTLQVREKTGHLIRAGSMQLIEQIIVQSAGNACSHKGQNVLAVLSLPKSA